MRRNVEGRTSNGGSAAEAVAAAQAGDDVARSVADRAAPASGPRGDVHAHERWRDQPIFSEFHVTNPKSRNTYRFVIRGSSPGTNVCSCPNLATNTLGTCKHVEFVSEEVEEGHSEAEEGVGSGNSDASLSGNSDRSLKAPRSRSSRGRRSRNAASGRGRSDRSHGTA